jgi:tRNA uridine 5-carbamoylmethylation protein Kti12
MEKTYLANNKMPNNCITIWKTDLEEIELQNQIRIMYHRLKEIESNQVFISDAYNYYKGVSKIRPNIERIERSSADP